MALPVIDGVFRVTINYSHTSGNADPHNVLHFASATGNEEDLADALDANITGVMLAPLSDFYSIESYDIIKLDGTSAQQTFNRPGEGGSGTGNPIPASAAVLSLHTAQRGPRGRGRLFLGPTSEGSTNDGVWSDATDRALVAAGWQTFIGAMVGGAEPFQLGVASYVHADFNPATSFSVRTYVGTLRRRQDQLIH